MSIKRKKVSELPEATDTSGFWIFGSKTIDGVVESVKFSFDKITSLFGVSQEKGQDTTLAPSLKLFTDEVYKLNTDIQYLDKTKLTVHKTPDGYFLITDEQGNIALMITPTGQFDAADITLLKDKIAAMGFGDNTDIIQSDDGSLFFCDKKGYVAAMINMSGQFNAADITLLKPKIEALGFVTNGVPDINLSEVTHILSYGQSLSVGVAGGSVVSTSQKYNNKMFIGGTMPQYSTVTNPLSDWTPLIEAHIDGTNGAGDETPLSGASDRLIQTLIAQGTISSSELDSTVILASAPGEGAQPIAALIKGSTSGLYNRVLDQIRAGYSLAQSKGLSYNVPAIFWTQGETDISYGTTAEDYRARLQILYTDLNTDIKAVTKQSNDVAIIMYQVASHNLRTPNNKPDIALLQLDMGLNIQGIYLATAMYHLEYLYGGTNVHLPSKSYRLMGEYYGYVLSQVMQGIDWKPMYIRSITVQGKIIILDIFAPVYPIVIDTNTVSTIDNYGFSIKNASNSEIIQSVEIIRGNSIKIVCSESPTGLILDYAINGTGAGNVIGARGNIRDSQGDSLKSEIQSTQYRMDNWLPISRINL